MREMDDKEVRFELTPNMRKFLDLFRAPGSDKSSSLLASGRDESHVPGAVSHINQVLDTEDQLSKLQSVHPAIQMLENEEAIGDLSPLLESQLHMRLKHKPELPISEHLDEILDSMVGPALLTTDALRRFFYVAAQKLSSMLLTIAHSEQRRRMLLRQKGELDLCVPEAFEQVKSLNKRLRARTLCLRDILESSRGAEILLSCLDRDIPCKSDARLFLQMHLLCGCRVIELSEYFGIRKPTRLANLIHHSMKTLRRKALLAAKREPGYDDLWSI